MNHKQRTRSESIAQKLRLCDDCNLIHQRYSGNIRLLPFTNFDRRISTNVPHIKVYKHFDSHFDIVNKHHKFVLNQKYVQSCGIRLIDKFEWYQHTVWCSRVIITVQMEIVLHFRQIFQSYFVFQNSCLFFFFSVKLNFHSSSYHK